MSQEKEFIERLNTHQGIVHRICQVYGHDHWHRQDLFQEIVLQAWKAFPSFRGDAKFSTWLYRVALNTAITDFRRGSRHNFTVSSDVLPEQPDTGLPVHDERLAALYKSIAALSKIDKALVMLYLDDYSYQDIAAIMGMTPNHVAVKMNRIRGRLREESKKHYTV